MTSTRTDFAATAGISALVFDVLGTVVDETGSIAAQTTAALAAAGIADRAAASCSPRNRHDRLDAMTNQVAAGEAPWRSNDALRRRRP